MALRALKINFRQLLDIRPGEAARIGFMAAFLFFCLPPITLSRLSETLFFSAAFR